MKLKKYAVGLLIFLAIFVIGIMTVSAYTADSYSKIKSRVCPGYTAPSYSNINSRFGESESCGISNTAPFIQNISITPNPAYTDSQLNCSANYGDSESNKGNVSITWYNGSAQYSTTTILDVVSGAMVSNATLSGIQAKGEAWNCTINATDVQGSAGAPNSTTITISNLAPSVPEIGGPENATRAIGNSQLLRCANSTDADSDTINYVFYGDTTVNPTSLLQNLTSTTYTWSTSDGSTYYWRCKAEDSATGVSGFTAQKTFTENTAPTVTNVAINPSSPNTADTLNCSANFSDAETDKLNATFTWYNGSVLYSSINIINIASSNTNSSYLLTSGIQAAGERWNCSVNPFDSYENGTSLNASVLILTNQAPVSGNVSAISAQSVTEGGMKSVSFSFTATDANGAGDFDDTTARANFTLIYGGWSEDVRENTTCKAEADIDTYTANYSCIIGFWYWDAAGLWNVSFSVKDSVGAGFTNRTGLVQLQETTGMVLSPGNITWPSIGAGNTNKTSDNDPIIINNTGNKNISLGNVRINAVDLRRIQNPAYKIYAANFTTDIETGGSCSGATCVECDGTGLVNGTATGITNSILTRGNLTAAAGKEELYLCLKTVGTNLSAQTYSTTASQAWLIDIE